MDVIYLQRDINTNRNAGRRVQHMDPACSCSAQNVSTQGAQSSRETGTFEIFHQLLQFTVALPSVQSETCLLQQSFRSRGLGVLAQKSFKHCFLRPADGDHLTVRWRLAMQILVVTALKSRISSRVSSKFMQPMAHLLRSFTKFWPAYTHIVSGNTRPRDSILPARYSAGIQPDAGHSAGDQRRQGDPGGRGTKIGSKVSSRFKQVEAHLLHFWQMG